MDARATLLPRMFTKSDKMGILNMTTTSQVTILRLVWGSSNQARKTSMSYLNQIPQVTQAQDSLMLSSFSLA